MSRELALPKTPFITAAARRDGSLVIYYLVLYNISTHLVFPLHTRHLMTPRVITRGVITHAVPMCIQDVSDLIDKVTNHYTHCFKL